MVIELGCWWVTNWLVYSTREIHQSLSIYTPNGPALGTDGVSQETKTGMTINKFGSASRNFQSLLQGMVYIFPGTSLFTLSLALNFLEQPNSIVRTMVDHLVPSICLQRGISTLKFTEWCGWYYWGRRIERNCVLGHLLPHLSQFRTSSLQMSCARAPHKLSLIQTLTMHFSFLSFALQHPGVCGGRRVHQSFSPHNIVQVHLLCSVFPSTFHFWLEDQNPRGTLQNFLDFPLSTHFKG